MTRPRYSVVLPKSTLGFQIQQLVEIVARSYFSSHERFYENFDLFELLMALSVFHQTQNRGSYGISGRTLARTAYYHFTRRSDDFLKDFWQDAGKQQENWLLLRRGWLDGNPNTLKEILHWYMYSELDNDKIRAMVYDKTDYSKHYLE